LAHRTSSRKKKESFKVVLTTRSAEGGSGQATKLDPVSDTLADRKYKDYFKAHCNGFALLTLECLIKNAASVVMWRLLLWKVLFGENI
jgi:hypothetical protein